MKKNITLIIAAVFSIQLQSQVFNEGFEGGTLPDPTTGEWILTSGTWRVMDNGVGTVYTWETVAANATNPPIVFLGQSAAFINRENIGIGNTHEDWLISPQVVVPEKGVLDFMCRTHIIGEQGTLHQIRISTTSQTDPNAYIPIEAWTDDDMTSDFNIYQRKVVDLEPYEGQPVYIAFIRIYTQPTAGIGGDRWFIDEVNISSSATTYNTLNGTLSYGGYGSDCSSPLPLNNIPVVVASADNVYQYSENGAYTFVSPAMNFNIQTVIDSPYYISIPPSYDISFPDFGNTQSADFCILADGVHHDLQLTLLPYTEVKVGEHADYIINYKNVGTEVQSGNINFTFDDSVMDLFGIFPAGGIETVNNINFSFSNLQPFESRNLFILFDLNGPTDTPAVNIGDMVTSTATITSANTDEAPIDNTSTLEQEAVSAVDPNDIRVLEGEQISISEVGNYLNYIIRFQNVGNAAATIVKIRDLIEDDLDTGTIQVIGGSHAFSTSIENRILEFTFNNINLPDATTDEPNSHGWVAFRIKPATSSAIGTVFSNSANIYFDFNYPIATNLVNTEVVALATQSFEWDDTLTIYPNPASETVSIKDSGNNAIEKIEIFNLLGQSIQVIDTPVSINIVDVSALNTGTYLVEIQTANGKTVKKLVIE